MAARKYTVELKEQYEIYVCASTGFMELIANPSQICEQRSLGQFPQLSHIQHVNTLLLRKALFRAGRKNISNQQLSKAGGHQSGNYTLIVLTRY